VKNRNTFIGDMLWLYTEYAAVTREGFFVTILQIH